MQDLGSQMTQAHLVMGHSSDRIRGNVDYEPQLKAVSSRYCLLPEVGSDLPAVLSCSDR